MARKTGKKYQSARKQVEAKEYQLEQAIPLLQKIKFVKFDEGGNAKALAAAEYSIPGNMSAAVIEDVAQWIEGIK